LISIHLFFSGERAEQSPKVIGIEFLDAHSSPLVESNVGESGRAEPMKKQKEACFSWRTFHSR
jgi:hypothetical protein